jgi:hypothetical protein
MMTLFLIGSSLAGCAVPARVGVEYFDHARPIYFDSAAEIDRTPADVRRQVLEANETWAKLCRSYRGSIPLRSLRGSSSSSAVI